MFSDSCGESSFSWEVFVELFIGGAAQIQEKVHLFDRPRLFAGETVADGGLREIEAPGQLTVADPELSESAG